MIFKVNWKDNWHGLGLDRLDVPQNGTPLKKNTHNSNNNNNKQTNEQTKHIIQPIHDIDHQLQYPLAVMFIF